MINLYKWLSNLGVSSDLTYIENLRTTIFNWASLLLIIYLTLHSIDIYVSGEPGCILSVAIIFMPILSLYLNYTANYLWSKINLTWLLTFITLIYWMLYGNESSLGFCFLGFFLGAFIAYDNKTILILNLVYILMLITIGGVYNFYYENILADYVSNFDTILNYGITFSLLAGAIIYFISGLKFQEGILRDQQDRLKNKNAALLISDKQNKNKTELLKMIAHDLRGPISSYKNLSQKFNYLILNNDIENILEIAAHMEKSGDRLFSNLENLMNWVLTQQDRIVVVKKHISKYEIVQEIISELNYISQPKEITINNNVSINGMVYSDRDMLRIILRNLIDNAIKYSPRKSTIEICSVNDGATVSIIVKDSGCGIKPEMLKHIKNQNNVITLENKSYGIGLTICYYFADIINAELSIDNKEDAGVIAKINLQNVF